MPEMRFLIRWPDGRVDDCYSPSLVVKEFCTPGTAYPVADFLARMRQALTIASRRVEAKYGFPCSRAAATLAGIEARSAPFLSDPHATVAVEGFQ